MVFDSFLTKQEMDLKSSNKKEKIKKIALIKKSEKAIKFNELTQEIH
jgi:hypothetical protein